MIVFIPLKTTVKEAVIVDEVENLVKNKYI